MADISKFESIDTKEAAPILHTTPNKVRQLLQTGALRGYKLGRGPKAQWRVTTAELDRFMSEGPANE